MPFRYSMNDKWGKNTYYPKPDRPNEADGGRRKIIPDSHRWQNDTN